MIDLIHINCGDPIVRYELIGWDTAFRRLFEVVSSSARSEHAISALHPVEPRVGRLQIL